MRFSRAHQSSKHRLQKVVAAALGLGIFGLVGNGTEAQGAFESPLLVTQMPQGGSKGSPERRDEDWEGAHIVLVDPAGTTRVLTEGFAAACDPNVSFDGQKVLFAGRKPGQAGWRIYEIGIDGAGLRAVSPEHLDARSPIYVSTLFTLDSPEPWFTAVFVGRETNQAHGTSLYNVKLDGGELRRLTYNPARHFDPVQMWDGRLLYATERWPIFPGDPPPRIGLNAIHIEGADMERYGGELGGQFQRAPCPTENGLMVFVETDPDRSDGAGQLACVEQRRPHVTYRRLTEDKRWVYRSPSCWQGGVVLAPRRAAEGRGTWTICAFDTSSRHCEPILERPGLDHLQAVVVKPRKMPDGHSTVVETRFTSGFFYGLNCYDTATSIAPYWQTGMVKQVRFVEGVLGTNCDPTTKTAIVDALPRRLIGEAPVEEDGSFNVEVPADIPLFLQVLDERGLALANCGWIWVKPREKRGCIGCHEDPERIPENEYVLALRRPSNRLLLPELERRAVAFREDIAPILRNHCATADCHAGRKTPLRMSLDSENPSDADLRQAYSALMITAKKGTSTGKFVDPGRARTSRLVWHLAGRDLSRPWDKTPQAPRRNPKEVKLMPPAGKGAPLTDEEMRTVIRWIDMGAQFEAPRPENPENRTVATTR
jgi:hypothetical protein